MKKRILGATVLALALAVPPVGKAFAAPLATWSAVDWSTVDSEIDAAVHKKAARKNTNENIDIATGDSMEVPAGTLEKMIGENVTLAFHTGNGIAISVSGKDLKRVNQGLNIIVTDEEDVIPEYASQGILSGALYSRIFAMKEKIPYDVRLNIHFCLGREFAKKYANLYHFDELNERMVCDGSFVITDGGMAMFSLERGDEYILTVTDGLPVGGRIGYTVAAGDCLSRIASRNGVSLKKILAANPEITDADKIYPGEVIIIVN